MDIVNVVGTAICPIVVGKSEGRLLQSRGEIRGYVDFHPVFLRILSIVFWVTTGDKDPSVVKQNGLAVIKSCHAGLSKNGEALVTRLERIVQNGL